MSRDGEVKLSDFGIARLFGNTRMTNDGGILGTAEYMAPEQADGRPVTDRCDQYSLGGVMFTLLAGRPPFRASSFVEMLQLQRFSEAQPVSRFAPDTPAELDRIIAQLLEKDPAKRFSNALMLARSLEAMERGLSVSSARDDFVINDPKRTSQPHLAGLDPYAATLVPSDDPLVEQGPVARAQDGTVIHSGKTIEPQRTEAAVAPATRFTKVKEEAQAPGVWYQELTQVLFAPQSLGLVVALVAMLAGAWYLLRPLSADRLYDQTISYVGDGEIESLRKAEPGMNEFLERFPDDPRTEEFETYKQQLVLARKARHARLYGRTSGKRRITSPIERAFLEATQLAAFDPDAAIVRLQAIVELYGSGELEDEQGVEFVEIARQELEALNAQLAAETIEQRKLLENRAKRARQLEQDQPQAARRMWEAVVELYGEKPWAAPIVKEAKRAISRTTENP
jgi:serine/threonine-protein kinase